MPERYSGTYDGVAVHDEAVKVVLRGGDDLVCRRLLQRPTSCFTMRPAGSNPTYELGGTDDFSTTYGEVSYRNGQLLFDYAYAGISVPTSCTSELDSYRPAEDGAWVLLTRLELGDAEAACTVDRLQRAAQ
jgi:hypothetical protein